MFNSVDALLDFAISEEENAAKFSMRTTGFAIQKGVNLGEVMQKAAEKFNGKGGGHNIAAGAQVPIDKIEEFVNLVNVLVGKQIVGMKIGS